MSQHLNKTLTQLDQCFQAGMVEDRAVGSSLAGFADSSIGPPIRVGTGQVLPDTPIEGEEYVLPRYRKRADTSLFDEQGIFALASAGDAGIVSQPQVPEINITKIEDYQE